WKVPRTRDNIAHGDTGARSTETTAHTTTAHVNVAKVSVRGGRPAAGRSGSGEVPATSHFRSRCGLSLAPRLTCRRARRGAADTSVLRVSESPCANVVPCPP